MSAIIKLQCDKCNGISSLDHYGTLTDARVNEFKYGWFYDTLHGSPADLCPVCSGRDENYWTAEPF
jgi:hypothetical protein